MLRDGERALDIDLVLEATHLRVEGWRFEA
jgi:hypothetical protein